MAYTIDDYKYPTFESLKEQWESVLSRESRDRQVAFVPLETLLTLAASHILPSDFNLVRSADPKDHCSLIEKLSNLFKRRPRSFASKVDNLTGARPKGGWLDTEVFLYFEERPERLREVYSDILTVARACGIHADRLPDFLNDDPFLRDLATASALLLGQEKLGLAELERAAQREVRKNHRTLASEHIERTERVMLQKIRVGQSRFARSVLENCGGKCAFCGVSSILKDVRMPRLLSASHIKPWSDCESRERIDVRNGLAACPPHDYAFDLGLMTLTPQLGWELSRTLRERLRYDPVFRAWFEAGMAADGRLMADLTATPASEYISWHRSRLFQNWNSAA